MPVTYKAYRHEIADDCAQVHCHVHNVDERDDNAYICCIECGHVYRTAGALRRAYRRKSFLLLDWSDPWFRSNDLYASVLRVLWRALTIRARDIFFCQMCSHNF